MNASLQVVARTCDRVGSRADRSRVMDFENQTASTDFSFSGIGARREDTPSAWPDAWLINAVRRDPLDEPALDALVGRYWKALFARCRVLTLDRESANDLAQDAWLRVIRARHLLEPDGNFHAYVITVATNLWRDRNRAAQRAGPMADSRVASLDEATPNVDGETMALLDVLPDPHTLSPDEQVLLKLDMDQALQRLDPQLRDVLVSRFVAGESAAEIGHRYGRTEQTISGWLRKAVREMQVHLGGSRPSEPRMERS